MAPNAISRNRVGGGRVWYGLAQFRVSKMYGPRLYALREGKGVQFFTSCLAPVSFPLYLINANRIKISPLQEPESSSLAKPKSSL